MKTNLETQAIVAGIIDYLQSKQAMDLLPEIIEELTRRTWGRVDPDLAVVTAPVKLTASQQKAIKEQLTILLNRPVRVKTKIDKQLVAGFTVEVGGQVIDATIDKQLSELKQKLIYD